METQPFVSRIVDIHVWIMLCLLCITPLRSAALSVRQTTSSHTTDSTSPTPTAFANTSAVDGSVRQMTSSHTTDSTSPTPTAIANTPAVDGSGAINCSSSSVSLEIAHSQVSAGVCMTPVDGQDVTCTAQFSGTKRVEGPSIVPFDSTVSVFNVTIVPYRSSFALRVCLANDTESISAGFYQWSVLVHYLVDNISRTESIDISVTITDVNDPPQIHLDAVSYNISESTPTDAVILTFNVTDPDALMANGTAPFRNITKIEISSSGGNGSTSQFHLLEISPDQFELILVGTLNASVTAVYTLSITATDGGGLNTTVNVDISVTDVNEAPKCASDVVIIDVSMQMSENRRLGRLHCWDWDITPEYTDITFSPSVLFGSLLTIDANGNVFLAKAVTVDTVSRDTVVSVFAAGYQGLSFNVTVSLRVAPPDPPQCLPAESSVTFPDSAPSGTCAPQTVQCSSTGSDLQTASNSTDGPMQWRPQEAPQNSSMLYTLNITLCITRPLFHLTGQYQANLSVSNSAGMAWVMWSVNVVDTNQAPQFLNGLEHIITVPENTPVQETVAEVHVFTVHSLALSAVAPSAIIVWDPDTGTAGYEISNVTVYGAKFFERNKTLNTVSSLPIHLNSSTGPPYAFLTRAPLTAGQKIVFDIQAMDRTGASSNASVTFDVTDINSAPRCVSGLHNMTLPLVTSVNTPLYTLLCTDDDVTHNYSSLTFSEDTTSQSDYMFFSVNDSGVITLQQPVPINVSIMTYTVYVSDGGGLVTNYTITFDIFRDYPPSCSDSQRRVTLLEDANHTQCQSVKETCSQQPAQQGRLLSLNFFFTYDSSFFQVESMVNSTTGLHTFTVCPAADLLGRFGNYNLTVNVSSELGSSSYPWTLTVEDVNQAPRFNSSAYHFSVPEDLPHGSVVAQVLLPGHISDLNITDNIILLLDPDTAYNFSVKSVYRQGVAHYQKDGSYVPQGPGYFQGIVYEGVRPYFFSVNGKLTTGHSYVFQLMAKDRAGLEATTNVTFAIYDVNDDPECSGDVLDVTLNLTSPVNTLVCNVTCTDRDMDPQYSTLTYHGYSTKDFAYFNISTAGEVTLTSELPTDVSNLQYDVYVRDGGGLTANVTIHVFINRNFGPQCTPPHVAYSTRKENATGLCSPALSTCVDTTGRGLPLTLRVISNALQGQVTVQSEASVGNNSMTLKMCPVAGQLLPFGQFEIYVEVNNTLTSAAVTFNITIDDVNQSPHFQRSAYSVTVAEDAPAGGSTTLAVVRSSADFEVPDVLNMVLDIPDTWNYINMYITYEVLSSPVDGAQDAQSDPGSIQLRNRSFVVMNTLKPQLFYHVNLSACYSSLDSWDLCGNTCLKVTVTDVNQAPRCEARVGVVVDLLQSVPSTVYTLHCTDTDYKDTYRSLRYFSDPVGNFSFFNVTETGDVILWTSVPRDSRELVLHAYATDGGGLRANTTVTFNISSDHPPECFPAYIHPDSVWEIGSCFQIYPNCSDPTTSEGDKSYLTYVFTGSWQSNFRQNMTVKASGHYAEFCYLRTTGGNYKIQLDVDNQLGTYRWETDVIVSYRDAPPKFTVNRYIAEVQENETAGFPVVTVEALVDGRNGSLLYSFKEAAKFGLYFNINSTSGQVSVRADLLPLVGTQRSVYVTAVDPQTGLNHSVPLTVKVLDVNQPPVCQPAVMTTSVLWSITVNDTVATVNCTDPDPTPGFSNLFYVVGGGRQIWRSDRSEVKLLSRALLEANTPVYILTVMASDGVFTATTTVTVNMDRTPPKPDVTVSNIQVNTVTLHWSFDPDYTAVIDNFTIVITDFTGHPRIIHVDKRRTSLVIGNLTQQTTYSVNVTISGLVADITSSHMIFVTAMMPILKHASAEFQLPGSSWTSDLMHMRSSSFQALSDNVSAAIDTELRNLHGYVCSEVRGFREGSVLVDVLITTNQSVSSEKLRSFLQKQIITGSIGSLAVNSSYFQFYIGKYHIADVSLEYSSPGTTSGAFGVSGHDVIVSGYDVIATCSARTPGVLNTTFHWRLNGLDVSTMDGSGRYNVSAVRKGDSDPFYFYNAVTIQDILVSESGILSCIVAANDKVKEKKIGLEVVASMTATLTPLTVIVNPRSDVILTCTRIAGYSLNWTAVLYRIDNQRVQVERANVARDYNQTNFVISSVMSNAFYQCDVIDKLGGVRSFEASIIISHTDARECPADGEWSDTPAGNTVRLPCPPGYSATRHQSRVCAADGQWGKVDSSLCVKLVLENLKVKVEQIEEGTTKSTVESVVEELVNSTSGPLLHGDVNVAVTILGNVANITRSSRQTTAANALKEFLQSADNVLHAPEDAWQNQTSVAFSLVHSVDKMGEAASEVLNSSDSNPPPIQTGKILLEVGRTERQDIHFPNRGRVNTYPAWLMATNTSVFLSKQAFPYTVKEVRYSAVIYRNLSNVFSGQLEQSLTNGENLSINSPILALSVRPQAQPIQQPVLLTFDHITSNFSDMSCQFLNFSLSTAGRWSGSGCRVKSSSSLSTVCECDHLTNFAVLMSPYRPTAQVADVLTLLSIVGCSVSIFCLVLTLLSYFIFWRYVKSDRSVILVNLCVILLLAYITFLAGVNRVEYKVMCRVVAALLHYLWLVVFFLMLCEGLDIFISVVIVFPMKSVLVLLLLMAYGVPLIIVGASLGITQLDGYGGSDFCWLSLEDGLLWAFVGPALAALLANFVFVALVIRALLSTTSMITKSKRERAKSVLKAICVMTPILGLTWIFGVMSVNNDTLAFQILFVVFNSLQGLMIFVFHCLLSKQVREGFQNKRRRQRAKSLSTDSSSRYVTQKQISETSMSGNDLGKTTSPFLQVDRQVQQMASKVGMLDSHNLMTSFDPPKDVALKNPVAGKTGIEYPFMNIVINESSTDVLGNTQEDATDTAIEPSFKIEAGNLKTISKPSASTATDPTTAHPQARWTTTDVIMETSTPHIVKDMLTKTDSVEDNARQSSLPLQGRQLLQTQSSSSSGASKGSQQQGRTTSEAADNQEDGRQCMESVKSSARRNVAEQERHQLSLDDVYGAGARVSANHAAAGRPYVKHKGRQSSHSADNVPMASAPRNPVYNDVMPALSPTDRWLRAAQAAKQLSSSRPPADNTSFYKARSHSSSSRRIPTSAETLQHVPFQPFSAPRHGDVKRAPRHGDVKRAHRKPPHVAPKPSGRYQEPPVDYW